MTSLDKARALALLVPAALLAAALGSQYIGGLFPCEMCHWQRWGHYAAVAFALVSLAMRGAADRGRSLVWLAALTILASGVIGGYHAGVEAGVFEGFTQCASSGATGSAVDILADIMATPLIRCDQIQWAFLGISMAGWNAIVSLSSGMLILWLSLKTPSLRSQARVSTAWRPGDDHLDLASMIRVDQAGEYGATRIYAGQLAVLGEGHPTSRAIARMALQEKRHLDTFDRMMIERGVRPTMLQPFWNVAGHALGAVTALMSPAAAMACTAAVETEIDKHYAEQREQLREDEPELGATIAEFQAEELEHKETAIAAGAESSFGYPVLSAVIRAGCRAAIALSKKDLSQ